MVQQVSLPPESYLCAAAPLVPEGEMLTDKEVALYITLLWAAWWDCALQLHAVGVAHARS